MENLKVAIIPVTPLMQNSCVIWNENTKNAAVTDPGGDLDKINDFLSKNNLNLVKIFITHGHLDHAGGAFNLSQEHDVKIEGPHPDDEFLISGLEDQGKMYGVPGTKNFLPDRWLDDGDKIELKINNVLILHDFETKNKRKKITYKLENGENIIEIKAVNSGKYPPNTSRIEFIDNKKKYPIITQLDAGKSAIIKLVK